MVSRLFLLCCLFLFSVSGAFAAEAQGSPPPQATPPRQATPPETVALSPDVMLQNGITALLQKFKQGGSQDDVMAFLNQEIVRYFDLSYMARLSAGYYWNLLNDDQRHGFEEYFKRTFFQALARQISSLGTPEIQFYPARPGLLPNEVTVSARIVQPKGMAILMDFHFYHGDQGWKIFDVVADGSSAVMYYRHMYGELANRYGIETLLAAPAKPATR